MSYSLSLEEGTLIDACLANDRLAQKALYERYKNAMFTLAYRITSDFDSAHDVLQDAFVQVFLGLHKFRRESTLGAWIKVIVVRTAYKKVKKKVYFEPIDNNRHIEPVRWNSPLDTEYLEKAIQALPAGYRSIFVLIEVEGYKHREVAEMMDISVGTSKSQLFHAKKLLQKRLRSRVNGYER